MDFREAIDDLCEKVGHEEVAEALGVSVQTVRQARMHEATKARRSPPSGWRKAVLRIAEDRVTHYGQLISALRLADDDSQKSPVDKTEGRARHFSH